MLAIYRAEAKRGLGALNTLYIDIQLFLLCLSLPSHPFSGILEIIKRLRSSLEDVGCFSVFLIMYLGPHLLTFRYGLGLGLMIGLGVGLGLR